LLMQAQRILQNLRGIDRPRLHRREMRTTPSTSQCG
jgi:hypothetical protein